MTIMEENFINTVLSLYKENNWRDVLELNKDSQNEIARKLLWVWPSENNLLFIRDSLIKNNCKGVISIGCGCGLLEWLLQSAVGVSVIGYEINEEWWKSRYCSPHFIKLHFADPDLQKKEPVHLDSSHALLFCYFNDGKAFTDYIERYNGNLVIIIGPGEGRGRHTDPAPFKANFKDNSWTLLDFQEVKDTKDFIAVYGRS